MDNYTHHIVEAIHDTETRISLAATGGGSTAIAWLLGVAGASRTVLEATIPYSRHAIIEYLGWEPQQFASGETAAALAAAAYGRAQQLHEGDTPVIGVGCTAAIITDRPKKGAHRCYVCVWDGEAATSYAVEMEKWVRDRAGEEAVVSQLILKAVGRACGLDRSIDVDVSDDETVTVRRWSLSRALEHLLEGVANSATVYGPGVFALDEPIKAPLLCGSFNPLHDGHLRLARAAERRLGRPVVFEMATHNVDKPALTADEINERLQQFVGHGRRVALSREPLYADKAALFPGSTFVVGYDTAARIVDPAYYDDDPAQMQAALEAIQAQGCAFLVAGRLVDDTFRTLDDLNVPEGYADLFTGFSEDEFRVDISSTELRERGWQ